MALKIPRIIPSVLPCFFVLLFVFNACKKDETGPNHSPIDPAFVGVWYSSADMIGFEVRADGNSSTLTVDTAGTLQYAKPGDGLTANLSLTIIEAGSGNLKADITYKSGSTDTTVIVPGVYTFSNNNNTVSITFPNPLTSLQSIMLFERSSIGALVKPKTIGDFLSRRNDWTMA